MRRYDDRYTHDMRRHDLALRLIEHEVRTQTIRRLTGLGDKRIRNLYRTYYRDDPQRPARRHRGPPPQRVNGILESSALRSEAAAVGGLFHALGVIVSRSPARADRSVPNLSSGERLCRAFELYRSLVPDSQIDFEHVMLLVAALARGGEIALGHCERCEGAILIDLSEIPRYVCAHCRRDTKRCAPKRRGVASKTNATIQISREHVRREDPLAGYQHHLFDAELSAEKSDQGVVRHE
jgi:hypothetical protein